MLNCADLSMQLSDCSYRLAFLQDALVQNIPSSNQPVFVMTPDGQNGLYAILQDVRDQIGRADNLAQLLINNAEVQP